MQSCQKDRRELSSVLTKGGVPESTVTPVLADVDKRTEHMAAIAILELRVPWRESGKPNSRPFTSKDR
jgi:hypothetical protein